MATFTVKDTAVESVTYTAKDTTDNITITQTAQVSFTAGTPTSGNSTVSASPTSITADGTTTSTVTVTLFDAFSHPVSGKTVTLAQGTGSSTISPASATTNASGVAAFTVKDTKAETVTYTARDTTDNVTITQTAQVTFTPGTPTAGNSTVTANPTSVTADGTTTSTITVTLEDAHNNPVSSKTVTLSQGTGSSTITTVSGTTNASGQASFTVKNTKAESVIYTATDTTDAVTVAQTATVTFIPGPVAKFVFDPISSPQTAGTAFNVTITAKDANDNTVTSYNANGNNVTLSSSGTIQGGSFTTPSFTNGVLNVSVTITNTGNFTLSVLGNPGHANGIIGTSNSFTVNPGAATHFTVSAPPAATAGNPINFTVTALDAFNNTATGYVGTAHFTSTDAQAVLPANYTFIAGDSGVHVFSATLKTAGNRTIATTDTSNGSINGTSGSITVSAGAAASVTPTAGTPQSATINSAFATNLGARVDDAYNNPVSGATVTFTAPGSGASGAFAGGVNTATTNASGVATATVFAANGTAGSYNVSASAVGVAIPALFALTNNNPAPTLTSVSPTSGNITQTLNVVLGGSNFLGATTVSFGSDIAVNSVTVNSGVQITANITIASTATLGPRAVSVTNPGPGGGTATLPGAFSVTGTPPHITSAASATFTAGTLGTFTVAATGTPTPALGKFGTLPGGVSFTDNGNGTATLTGTATTAGTFPITITAQNGITSNDTQNFILTVNAGPLVSIVLSPASQTITAGGSASFTATGYDQYGNSRGDVTGATIFSVTNGTCSGNSCSSTLAGSQTVTGNDSGIIGTATLNVTPGFITHLTLSPATASVAASIGQAYTAIGLDSYNNPAGDVTNSTTFAIAPDGSCTGASCMSNIADVSSSSHTVTGTYTVTGAQGASSLTVTAGSFAQLQSLVPGETAAPGTSTGKTGTPNTEYVNGQFQTTVNAVDQFWNVVNTVTDTVHIASTDTNAKLPADAALAAGTGTFNVTLESVSYGPPNTTLTASDETNNAISSNTSPAIRVIVVYTAGITPANWATGQQATYMLTINNAASPNTNKLASVEVAVPTGDQGTVSNISVSAMQSNITAANWIYDSNLEPGILRFHEITPNDAITPGGTITITFTATSSAVVSSSPVPEEWTTTAFSDAASSNPLPLASSEPTVNLGVAPQITSASSTNDFTYGTSGTTFTVTTNGLPRPSLAQSGSFPAWATFTDNGDGTATISGTPTAAGLFTFTITAHNGYGNDATQSFTLNVSKATLTPSLIAQDKTYDRTTTEPDAKMSCTLATVLSGDTVTCTPSSGSFNSSDVASADLVTATVTIGGASAGNYTLGSAGSAVNSTNASATAHIHTAPLTATLTAQNKTYDRTTTEPDAKMSCTLATVFSGDTVTCTPSNGSFNSSDVASADLVTATVTIGGTSAGNYTLGLAGSTANYTSATASAQIQTAPLAATLTAANKTYDRTTTETDASMSCTLATVVSGDNVTCTPSNGMFNSSQVTLANQVTATVAIGGTSAANYTLGATGTLLNSTSVTASAHILTAPLMATLTATSKSYDGTTTEPDSSMTCAVATLLSGDTVNCTPTNGTFNSSEVALANQVSATVTLGGISASNYTLGTAGTTVGLPPRLLRLASRPLQ